MYTKPRIDIRDEQRTDLTDVTYAKHLPEVRVSKPEGDVGHMESLGLGLAVRALR